MPYVEDEFEEMVARWAVGGVAAGGARPKPVGELAA